MERITINNIKGLSHKDQVRFALFCANQVKYKWKDISSCVEAIRLTELWLEGKATTHECWCAASIASTDAFRNSIYSATSSAAYVVCGGAPWASAHEVSICASYDLNLNRIKIIQEQWKYYYELRYFDEIAEKILLGTP